ncbi:MAG TPA: Calx-beta domain-containing protein [Allosphingosinicella sp.]|jgi:predicted extracellular nuclease
MPDFVLGNIVVSRVGTGSGALSGVATAVFLDEYTPTGTFVRSIALPTADFAPHQTLTATGNATTEGRLNLSADGRYLVLAGYDVAPGTATNLYLNPSSGVARVIGRVDASGAIDTTTALTNVFLNGNIRSAASSDGQTFWAIGSNTGIVTTTLGATTGTVIAATPDNLRDVDIYNGQLYISSGAGSVRMAQVGTGLPTTSGQTVTPLPGVPTASGTFNGFFFADLTAAVPGVDTLYLANEAGGLAKYSLVGGTWTSNGTITPSVLNGLTGSVTGGTVSLFATTASALIRFSDASGYNGTLTGTGTSIATAGTNTAFRGVSFAPQAAAPATPTINISDVSMAEGTIAGTTIFTFNVTLSGIAGPGGVTFDIATADGTAQDDDPATEDNDYVAQSLTGQSIAAGSSGPYQFSVTVNTDNIREGNETFFVNLTNVTGATPGDTQGQGTIQDDDTPALSIADVTQAEGNGGTSIFTFTVSLSQPAPFGGVTFDIATADNTATDADNDYEPQTLATQTILEGQTSYTFDVTVNGDAAVEPDETFLVNVTNVTGATVSDGQATGTIQNEDVPPIPVANVADVAVAEGDSGVSYLNFTVTLSFAPTGPVTIDYATSSGTATAGTDYLAVAGQLSFAIGETVKTIAVPIVGDTIPEAGETINLTLSNPSGATIGDGAAIGTITNDEGAGGSYFPLVTGNFEEDWTDTSRIDTNDDWSDVDYIIGYLGDIAPSTQTADVNPETLFGPALGAVDVLANQTNPSSAGSGGVAEFQPGATPETTFVANPTIALQGSGTADAPSIVLYMDSTGRTDVRLQATLRDIDYNADNAAQQINVQYRTDPTGNWTNVPGGHFTDVTTGGSATQTTAVDLLLPAGANNAPTLEIRIMTVNAGSTDEWVGIDDIVVSSLAGAPAYSIADAAVFEGTGGTSDMVFTVSRSGDVSAAGTAEWTISFGTGSFAASAADLAGGPLTGAVSFAPGEATTTIVVGLNPDADPEADEAFTVTLSNPSPGSGLGDAAAIGTIVNDDGPTPVVTISDVTQIETDGGNPAFVFTVTRTGATGAFDLNFQTADGSATGGSDYVITSGTVNFAAGEMSETIEILVFGDNEGEFDETFSVNLTSATNFAVIADPVAIGTILNDDPLYIHQIQGSSYYSPILAAEGKNGFNVVSTTVVTVQAVVTAVDNDGTRQGFYITEESGQWDANSLTSEGIFVMAQYDTTDTSNPPPGTGSTLAALLTANGIDPAGFAPGDLVTVSARVMENQAFDTLPRTVLWQVSSITKNSSGNELPVLTLDAGRPIPNSIMTLVTPDFTDSVGNTFDASRYALSFWETVEGMLVTIPDMVVADGFVDTSGGQPFFKAYSRVHADADQINSRGGYTIAGDPPLSPPDTADADDDTIFGGRHLHDGDVNPDIIEVDFTGFAIDAPAGLTQQLSMGDGLGNVTGIVDFDFTDLKLFVTNINSGSFVNTQPTQEVTALTGDDRSLTVATFNVENLTASGDPARFPELAGIIADNLKAPDIVIIEEIQDDNGTASGSTDASLTWQMLVDALNAAVPGANYQWVDQAPVNAAEGGAGNGNANIRVGFLYNTDRVQLGDLAADATLTERRQFTDRIGDGVRDAGDRIAFSDDLIAGQINSSDWSSTRLPLLAQFTFSGNSVFLVANHFTSKLGGGDFWQFNQNLEAGEPANAAWAKRTEQALDVYAMLDHIQTEAPDAGTLAGGDFNEFYFNRPIEALTGYVLADGTARAGGSRLDNLVLTLSEAERYSYTFDGRSQTLDHIVVNQLLSDVATLDFVHVNTGFNPLGTGADANLSLSDHDPALASFNFRSLSEILYGTPNRDIFRLEQGGNDEVYGLAGNDSFYFGAEFDENDYVDGDGGIDSILLQGDYSAGVTLGTGITSNIVGIETISLVPGDFNDYGDTSGGFYSYDLTTLDSNVAPGGILKVNGFYLRLGESFTFDGSAEQDGKFILLAGGCIDTLTGGAQNDIFIFGHDGRFAEDDSVDGGGGYDSVYLRGDYEIDFNDSFFVGAIEGVESVTLAGAADTQFIGGGDGEFDYVIVWNDDLLDGGTITFNGSGLGAAETLIFDGREEATASFRLWGGAAGDLIYGGAANDVIYGGRGSDAMYGSGGNDIFRFHSTEESVTLAQDSIHDFSQGDLLDLSVIDAREGTAANEAFTFIGSGLFTFQAGQLRAAVLSGQTWVVQADTDGDGLADLDFQVFVADSHTLISADFIL